MWWRRIAYFTTVMLTALLFARPFIIDANAGGITAVPSNGLSGAIGLLSTFLPGIAEPWIAFYQNRPIQLILLAALILGLLLLSTRLQQAIRDQMRGLWDAIATRRGTPVEPSGPPTDWVYRFRSHPRYRDVFDRVTQTILPFVFGFGSLAAIVVIAAGTLNRAAFAAVSAAGLTCIDSAPPRSWDGRPTTLLLPSNELCQQTGLELQQGQPYRVEIVLPDNDALPPAQQWRDASVRVETPAGFSSGQSPLFLLALPFRRVLTTQWFVPMVRVGNHVAEYHALDQIEEIPPDQATTGEPEHTRRKRRVKGFAEFTPVRTGQMFLFVNDAILPGPWVKTL